LKKITIAILIAGVISVSSTVVLAHFQILVPNTDLAGADQREVELDIIFTHPMENGPVMDMGEPAQFGVFENGARTDLKPALRMREIDGKTAYEASYTVLQPGDHVFYLEPAPYWEPAEGKMIIHFTKVVVNAFGEEEGWDEMVGFPVEIEPLVRPYGLWTGNAFRGIVRKNGALVPFAEIEVEYWNRDNEIRPPADPFITQVIKADSDGVFSYTMPRAGWWSFAALIDGDQPMDNPQGKRVGVEMGALIWVNCTDMR
jgi:cobalt/nickel transport protein